VTQIDSPNWRVTPFYDKLVEGSAGTADSTQFYDYPSVDGELKNRSFYAWLYLVSEKDGEITFYNGIKWDGRMN
jgi:hypothetical protein